MENLSWLRLRKEVTSFCRQCMSPFQNVNLMRHFTFISLSTPGITPGGSIFASGFGGVQIRGGSKSAVTPGLTRSRASIDNSKFYNLTEIITHFI